MRRSDAVTQLLDELESFEINLNQYYGDDPEPRPVCDSYLTGRLEALALFCRRLGWSDLAGQITGRLPLEGDGPEILGLVKAYVVPEMRHLIERHQADEQVDPNESFWLLLHPRIVALARPRFNRGFFGDAVEACFKEVNDAVKRLHFEATGKEIDGSGLMTNAFSPARPSVRLTAMSTQSERDEQQGYMQIYAGSMTGIRNPKAHANLTPSPRKTLHLVALASLLMHRLDERI